MVHTNDRNDRLLNLKKRGWEFNQTKKNFPVLKYYMNGKVLLRKVKHTIFFKKRFNTNNF